MSSLKDKDFEAYRIILKELRRQQNTIKLIASENYLDSTILRALSCIMTNKYAEGYPGARYYGGCENVDAIEDLARSRATALFHAEHANVQPHSGSQANMAVYFALLERGDKILAMNLNHGGHLTHGHHANFSGKLYNIVSYGVRRDNERIDYDEVERLALEHRPKLIVAGTSAYSRALDFQRFADIANKASAYLMVDMAHIAGLVAAGLHQNPCPYADVVTTTTHKTLRGPRGGMILCKKELAPKIDSALFPGTQGGPLMHVIAAKAIALKDAFTDAFRHYQEQVIINAQAFCAALAKRGHRIVSGGTDTHLFLLDVGRLGITGADAELALESVHIEVNKNLIPFDTLPPRRASGIRIGTPAVTTRGFKEDNIETIAEVVHDVLTHPKDENVLTEARLTVQNLCEFFPLYEDLSDGLASDYEDLELNYPEKQA
jgi:glycine hydroxymethyltransferase